MQCCVLVLATYRKQHTPQLWMEGTGEGCGFFCSAMLAYLSTMSQQFCRRLYLLHHSWLGHRCFLCGRFGRSMKNISNKNLVAHHGRLFPSLGRVPPKMPEVSETRLHERFACLFPIPNADVQHNILIVPKDQCCCKDSFTVLLISAW